MKISTEALNRAFDIADGIDGTTETSVELLRRVGIDHDVLAFLYRTVAGASPETGAGDEDRLATYLLGAVTMLLATQHRLTDDFLQRMPAPEDRWRGLSDEQVRMITVALEADVDRWNNSTLREECERLWHDSDAELTRRDAQPKED